MQFAHDGQLGAGDRLEVLVGDVAEPATRIAEVLPDVDLVAGEDADAENSPLAAISGWVSCFGDTLAITIGSSKLTWHTQWLQ